MTESTIPCISIRQPWAWFILHGGKDVENRTWHTRFRGRILVHAAKGCTRDEWEDADCFGAICGAPQVPELPDLPRGGIVGSVEIIDCVKSSSSKWFVGDYGFILRDPRPLQFVALKGALGIFGVPSSLLDGQDHGFK